MHNLIKTVDSHLLDLAWSLWTELGIAGVERRHQKFLISLEELILLTVALMKIDPRLRDESLDWSISYHRYISLPRLKSIMRSFGNSLDEPFSIYAATLNAVSKTAWPLFLDLPPLKINPSRKACLDPMRSPALLNIRVRSLFGTGARADLLTFFLTYPKADFAASDVAEIGYSKRNVFEILEESSFGGLFEKFSLRNQSRYRLIKNDPLCKLVGPIPDYAPSWQLLFEFVLPLRDRLQRTQDQSESTQFVEIRNFLENFKAHLERLRLKPPSQSSSVSNFLETFGKWLVELISRLAQGNFPDSSFLRPH